MKKFFISIFYIVAVSVSYYALFETWDNFVFRPFWSKFLREHISSNFMTFLKINRIVFFLYATTVLYIAINFIQEKKNKKIVKPEMSLADCILEIENGLTEIEKGLTEQTEYQIKVGQILLKLKYITKEQLAEALLLQKGDEKHVDHKR